jgi:hypothetical protein
MISSEYICVYSLNFSKINVVDVAAHYAYELLIRWDIRLRSRIFLDTFIDQFEKQDYNLCYIAIKKLLLFSLHLLLFTKLLVV